MYNSFLNYSPSGDHLSATTELDLLKNNKYNKICIPHEFRRPRLNGGIGGWFQTPMYGLCPGCVKVIAGTRINIAINIYKMRSVRRAESIRIAKEIHYQNQKKLNDVYKRKLKDIQIAEKLAKAELARRAEEIQLAEEAARVELALAEEAARVEFARRAEEIQLAEEAARVVRDDETAELRLKAENLRIHEEELRVERIRERLHQRRQDNAAEEEELRVEARRVEAVEAERLCSLLFAARPVHGTETILVKKTHTPFRWYVPIRKMNNYVFTILRPIEDILFCKCDCRENKPSSVGITSLKTKNRLQPAI